MKKRTKYYLLGAILIIAGFIGYHYIAANQAAKQIEKALAEQSKERPDLSVQFTSVDVAPLSADVTFKDLSISFESHIERAEIFRMDLGYFDFLNIYVGGLEYGLEHLYQAKIHAFNASYINRTNLNEVKIDSLELVYSGNALDGINSAISGAPFNRTHKLEANSSNILISLPNTPVTKLRANTLSYTGLAKDGASDFWFDGDQKIRLDSITWTPSKSFQNSYRFFIEGFGFPANAIPFDYYELQSSPVNKGDELSFNTSLKSELALINSSGQLKLQDPLERSQFSNTEITFTDLSDSFNNVLANIEQLFSINLPRANNSIAIQIEGTLGNPSIDYRN